MGTEFELEKEVDGRWIAEMVEGPRILTHGCTAEEAIAKAKALAQSISEGNLD